MEKLTVNGLFGLLIASAIGFYGCNDFLNLGNSTVAENDGDEIPSGNQQTPSQTSSPTTTSSNVVFKDEIVIGSFNIRTFGTGKLNNPKVMDSIVKVARYFDVLAIQEVRSSDQTMIPRFVQMINSNGSRYQHVIGPRQGSRRYYEQYVYIWNSDSVELIQKPWVVNNPNGKMVRQPLVAMFRCRTPNVQDAFTFCLANVHTDPHHARSEVDELAGTFESLQYLYRRANVPEDDILMLGDFNLSPDRFRRFLRNQNFHAAIPARVPTNLAGDKNYDNIVFDLGHTREFSGKANVFNLMKPPLNLKYSEASSVSDHFPVWAVFSTRENRSGMARDSGAAARR